VGSEATGVAFAIVLARAVMQVSLWDPQRDQHARGIDGIRERLGMLDSFDLLDESPESVIS